MFPSANGYLVGVYDEMRKAQYFKCGNSVLGSICSAGRFKGNYIALAVPENSFHYSSRVLIAGWVEAKDGDKTCCYKRDTVRSLDYFQLMAGGCEQTLKKNQLGNKEQH